MKENMLEYKDYLGSVHFSSDDKVFYGKIFGIDDMITFEGKTVNELENSFHEAVEDYITTCKKLKKTPEKSYRGSFNVRVPSEVHKQAALLAKHNNISLNEYVKSILIFAVKHPHLIKLDSK